MPKGQQDHGAIAVLLAVFGAGLDQPLDLALGQIFAGAQLRIGRTAALCNIHHYGGWRNDDQSRFYHLLQAPLCIDFHQNSLLVSGFNRSEHSSMAGRFSPSSTGLYLQCCGRELVGISGTG
jgi:hypothetical protein